MALAYTVRDFLIENWHRTTEAHYAANPKFVYYLSAEYLLGQQLTQNLLYTDTLDLAREAFAEFDVKLDDLIALDKEPGLGNGGLGRLAACFLDSLATLDIPAVGYGIRYEYGIFNQSFRDGWQIESPDDWLFLGNPWEFSKPDDMVAVHFGGRTEQYLDDNGQYRIRWIPGDTILGEPYHMLSPGYGTRHVNLIRLWRARATKEFDFQLFDFGDYTRAVEQKVDSETITKVLYPNDNAPQGRELRLKQQYFFVACSLRDIIRRFHIRNHDWEQFPNKVAIQLNDTHPVVGIPELMRLLLDEYKLDWDRAWDITRRTFAYTCHTLMPEALERWPVALFESLLPRHLEIIYEINHRFLQLVRERYPGDEERVIRMSIIEEGGERMVRMVSPGGHRQLFDQRRGRAAKPPVGSSAPWPTSRTLCRRSSTTRPTASPAAFRAPGQPAPVRTDHRDHRRRLATRPERLPRVGTLCRRPPFPPALARHQAGQQSGPRRHRSRAHRRRRRPE